MTFIALHHKSANVIQWYGGDYKISAYLGGNDEGKVDNK